ncbi:MAG: succinylglutamate desuccinylase/aspartoacylase family protein [Mariniphaga sp.]|nr:succinylglutamate desuccinylase/aspartoacylase family protein [Mariniphaga sp.]MDD4226524.1 succinylglutamate desuccinylase/aspartoacylase family protein [Mariniphaga sp.]MDD4424509.1 succinylglutamate desuccinylase/aspartoacylase family protein [Mariniphaga sp.]
MRKKKYKEIFILGEEIPPGKKRYLNLDIARLHTYTKPEVPVVVERAKTDGPTLLLTAGIHGNELNGVEILRELLANNYTRPDAGMVISIPTVNIFGFINQTREFPDGKDLNRAFPGSRNGSLASIFAHHLMNEILPLADYCVDFHTGGSRRFNSSQIRISKNNEELLELAKVFNPRFIVYAPQREKSFREAAMRAGKKVLLFEGGKTEDFNHRITRRGLYGTLRLMHHLGMRDFSAETGQNEFSSSIIIKESTWIRALQGGLFRFFVKDGSRVEKGQVVGTISDPYGKYIFKVKIPQDGYVIGMNHAPVVYRGDAILHLGLI